MTDNAKNPPGIVESQLRAITGEYALEAIETTKAWMNGFKPATSSEIRDKILTHKFHETCEKAGLSRSEFSTLWTRTYEMAKNPAAAQFLLDTKACESEFFVPWQNAVPRAVILEASYGYGYDLKGVYRKIPETDPFYVWVKYDAGLNFTRWRDQSALSFIKGQKKVLFLGAGWLPELRHTDYFKTSWKNDTELYCCDTDESIDKQVLFSPDQYPATAQTNIHYRHIGLVQMLEEMKKENQHFDAVISKGVMSYCLDDLKSVIEAVLDLIKPGQSFLFDLQTKHWSMMRNGYVFGWGAGGAIELLSVEEINTLIADTCKDIPHTTISYDADPVNDQPVGVVVKITK